MITFKVNENYLFRTEYDILLPNGKVITQKQKPTDKELLLIAARNDVDFTNAQHINFIERRLTTEYAADIAEQIKKLESADIEYWIEWEGGKKKDHSPFIGSISERVIKDINKSIETAVRNTGVTV